jgi:uncharacterized membrane protein YkoI
MLEHRGVLLALGLCLVAVQAAPATEKDAGQSRSAQDLEPGDHDRARKALMEGKIRPMREITAALASHLGGEVLVVEAELKKAGETYIYEFKVLTPDGRIRDVSVDAASGQIMANKFKHRPVSESR